jgi:hypothetical protein
MPQEEKSLRNKSILFTLINHFKFKVMFLCGFCCFLSNRFSQIKNIGTITDKKIRAIKSLLYINKKWQFSDLNGTYSIEIPIKINF